MRRRAGAWRFVPWWRTRRRRLIRFWGIGLAASIGVTAASITGYLESTQAQTTDLLIRLRGQRPVQEVVVVGIDDEAFDALGRRQPLSRAYLAKIVRGLHASGAAVVGLDVVLDVPTTAEDDRALATAIEEFSEGGLSRVVLASSTLPSTGPLASAAVRRVMHGAAELPEDSDGVIRRGPLALRRDGNVTEPVFALAVAARLGGMTQEGLERAVAAGRIHLPRSRAGKWPTDGEAPVELKVDELQKINFAGPAGAFLTIPSQTVAALGGGGAPPAVDNPFRGRVVFVGGTFRDSRDLWDTPHGVLPGVEIHANVAHMLLTRSFIRPSGWLLSLSIQLGIMVAAGLVMMRVRPALATLIVVGGAVVIGLPASHLAFERGSYAIDFMLPILATRLLGSAADQLESRRFRSAFDRYVSREVAAQILAEAPSLRGERREVSVLFSDIRGFTTLSEKMPPEEVATRLNEYFDAMTAAIFAHRGMVNDFIGDAVMAIFGAPVKDPHHAENALRAALAMEQALQALNHRWQASGLPALRMGIGVHTGEVYAGNIGGAKRLKYTIIGDAVNLAWRVQSLTKELHTTILLTDATLSRAHADLDVRDCGLMPVAGRDERVHVYELLAAGASAGRVEEVRR